MEYQIGTNLRIRSMDFTVVGFITYANRKDRDKKWTEYRLLTANRQEVWLSMDDEYKEYSLSWPANDVSGRIGPEWHEVDRGEQVVVRYGGDVDVDPGERANFIEYEDASEDNILSVEIWSDGTEFSKGYYIETNEIEVTGFTELKNSGDVNVNAVLTSMAIMFAVAMVFFTLLGALGANSSKSIAKYLKGSSLYTYETSITGNAKQKADVYAYFSDASTDVIAKLIIEGIEGNTESVTQADEQDDNEIAILTKKEYCLIYHPVDDPMKVYVQVSPRKYNYSSDNAPYKSSTHTSTWYRSHYYSSGYTSDVSSYKSTPSAYSNYNGTTIHNIGNGYFDSYSSSIRQSSINSRSSSSGGISSGK